MFARNKKIYSTPENIKSIDSRKDKRNYPNIFEQITFRRKESLRKTYCEKTITKKQKKNKEKRKQSLQNSTLEKIRSCFLPDLPTFCVKGKDKRAFSKGDLLIPPTQDYSNLLKDLFFCNFLISIESTCNAVGVYFGPEQQKKWSLLQRDGAGGSKGTDYTTLTFKI